MGNDDEVTGFTEKEKIILSCLIGWSILQTILFLMSDHYESSSRYFWPFDDEPLRNSYDFSEFAIYCLIPWVVSIIYRFLQKPRMVIDQLEKLDDSKLHRLRNTLAFLTVLLAILFILGSIDYFTGLQKLSVLVLILVLLLPCAWGWYSVNKIISE